jgi:general secretion pathway protein H
MRTCRQRRAGFTLLEILLAVGLIGLLAGVLVTASVRLTEPKPITAEDVFWKAVMETRKQALVTGADVRLRFVNKDKVRALIASSALGEKRYGFENESEVIVDFLAAQKTGNAVMIRSQIVETQPMPYVTFYGDGTCTPFRVQIRTGGAPRTVSIDPWTCSPVLTSQDKT